MKKVFIIACSAAMLSFCSLAQAQDYDSSSAQYNNDGQTEAETEQELEEARDDMQDAWEGSTTETEDDVNKTKEDINEGVDEARDEGSQAGRTAAAQIKDEKLESKVGPNGEPIFINEHAEYYYINDDGQKVKLEKSELKEKSE
ncbi:MAG TPA: hypothetical protein VD884_16150 [Ohtaekwangia sp.]|nr:hypothetical protein [Ohtaekwangia sp.]